jgi:oligopeptide/dipeptide ABC transporter ATP-binding protein
MGEKLLELDSVRIIFKSRHSEVVCADDVTLGIGKGETLGVVGESGCGKSVTALSILGLLGRSGRVSQGSIRFDGTDLLDLNPAGMRAVRGHDIAMIFQEPMTSLNPVMPIGSQLLEPIKLHLGLRGKEAYDLAIGWLDKVGIPRPEQTFRDFPDALSGGMRQRAMIAMAMVCGPKLLIADEPTTALDVTIQKQVLELMVGLKEDTGMAIMLITHDIGVIAGMADRVVVMYAGQVVEEAEVNALFDNPRHPYTKGLMVSVPSLDAKSGSRLASIKGTVPSASAMPKGCRFQPRCSMAMERCGREAPPLRTHTSGRRLRCWLYEPGLGDGLTKEASIYG